MIRTRPRARFSPAGPDSPSRTAELMDATMTRVAPLLDIPGRAAASGGSGTANPPVALPVRRLIGPAPFWFVTAISLGALAAAVDSSGLADRPSAARAIRPLTQSSITPALVPLAREAPVVLRGVAPPNP